MILVRNFFQAQYGRGDELVAPFSRAGEQAVFPPNSGGASSPT